MSESDLNSSHGNFLFISFSPLQWLYSIKAGLAHNCQAPYNNFRQSFLGHSALTILDLVVVCEGWALTGWQDCCCLFFCLFLSFSARDRAWSPCPGTSSVTNPVLLETDHPPCHPERISEGWTWQHLLRVMEEKPSRGLFLLFHHSWVVLCYPRARGSSAWQENWSISVL